MKTLGTWISAIAPKFNLQLVEGLAYHRINNAIDYINNFIRYSCEGKTNTHLRYLGYKELQPKDEMKFLFTKTNKVMYDIAKNDIYLVEFYFQYGENPEIIKQYFYIPFMNKGNTMHLSGNEFLISPVLADKVISIGEKIIFINILTAKYSFTRTYFGVNVNGRLTRVPLINTVLYKNQAKKLEDTTKANTTVMHYLLANYGYTKTMELLLGFVPTPVYDYSGNDKVVIHPAGTAPQGFIKNKNLYNPSTIKFVVDQDKYDEKVLYCIGNIFYIIDNFPESISIDELDSTVIWKRLLAEIIHSGNHGLAYLSEKINAHFNDLNSQFDTITVNKLADVNVNANSLIQLLAVIFDNFNNWIMSASSRSLYYNKTYEVESFVLANLTSRITRIVLDINKEELRTGGLPLDDKVVASIFRKYFLTRRIFSLKNEKQFVSTIEYSGDHYYPKKTAIVVQQESDFVDVKGEVNTSEKKKIVASMATVGSILGLSKSNPTPLIRLNPYVNVDPVTGTILPHPHLNDVIEATDKLLANVVLSESVDIETMSPVMAGSSEEGEQTLDRLLAATTELDDDLDETGDDDYDSVDPIDVE